MDYEKLVHSLVDPIVEEPDSLLIRVSGEDTKDVTILVAAEKADTARLIGKKGCVANALREIISGAGKSNNKRVHLKFESFEEEK